MDRATLERHLHESAKRTTEFARQHVIQELSDNFEFRVYPNQSYDDNPLVKDEVIFPTQGLSRGKYHGPWSAEQVVEFLWRDGKVPEWIDIAVVSERRGITIIALRCCGRFTGIDELFYYNFDLEKTPFGIKSPSIPPWCENSSAKFDLHWETSVRFRAIRFWHRHLKRLLSC